MKKLLTILTLLLLLCGNLSSQNFECFTQNNGEHYQNSLLNSTTCNTTGNYVPYYDVPYYNYRPIVYLNVNFHFLQHLNGTGNFTETGDGKGGSYTGYQYANDWINDCNNLLATNCDWIYYPTNQTTSAVGPTQIRFQIYTDPSNPNDKGIYFQPVADQYYYYPGADFSDLKNLYSINGNKVIDVWLQEYYDPNYTDRGGRAAGLGYGDGIEIINIWRNWPAHDPSWYQGTLVHETGHLLGLEHAWYNSYCPATIPGNSWNVDNNVMNYNESNCNWSECQLGVVHEFLTNNLPGYVSPVWCTLDYSKMMTINSGQNIVWNSSRYLQGGIMVEDYAHLTIQCGVYLPVNANIVVKQNGVLTIDGGTITNACGEMWSGIEVWGNSLLPQTINGYCVQGRVELKNNATIANAVKAICLSIPGSSHSSGGIVQANGANFINNKTGVEFPSYHNYNPITHNTIDNISYFKQCQFTTNSNYYGTDPFFAFITMSDVEGIKIRGCTLQNLTALSSNPNPPSRGSGLYSLNSSYYVSSGCASNYVPCPPTSTIPTVFQGLSFGINAATSGTSKSVRVFDSHFIDNDRGVYLSGVNNSTIVNNNFYIGTDNICPNQTGIGVELVNSFGYSVEDNYFTHSNTLPTGNWYIGICVKHPSTSGVTFNEIYRNTFDGLNVGNQAEGCNFNSDSHVGLQYYCNTNSYNMYDFYVNGYGIDEFQGSSTMPAGNKFTHIYNPNIPGSDFDNESTDWPVIYFYDINSINSSEQPIYINSPDKVIVQSTNQQNTCPSNYNGTGNQTMMLTQQQIDSLSQEFANNSIASDNILAIYENLKDGGSTSATNLDITSAVPAQTMQLREELLGKSPHLSEDVLKNAIDKYDVLPNAILLDILSANPDEMRNEELMNYLKSRTPAFPDYMIDLLSALALDTTYKTTLLHTLSSYNAKKTRAAYKILRNSLNDSAVDMTFFRNWLDNLHNINADYQIIDSWLQEGNSSSALSLLDMIPTIYNLGDSSLIEYTYFKDLKTIQANLIASGNDIFQMNTDQIRTLENIASMSKGIAGTQASNILEFGYGYVYPQCPAMVNQNTTSKSVKHNIPDLLNSIYEPKIKAFPNPANNWTAFYYELPDGRNNGSIEIADANGHNLKTFIVTNQKGQIIWDTREIISGIYLYICKCGKYLKTGKLTINH